jgi:hypothetical protein
MAVGDGMNESARPADPKIGKTQDGAMKNKSDDVLEKIGRGERI